MLYFSIINSIIIINLLTNYSFFCCCRPCLFCLTCHGWQDKGHMAVPPLLPGNWAEYRINEQVSLPQANMSCCCVCYLLCCVVFCESGCLSRLYFYEQLLIYRRSVSSRNSNIFVIFIDDRWTMIGDRYSFVDIYRDIWIFQHTWYSTSWYLMM